MSTTRKIWLGLLASFASLMAASMPAAAQQQKPNIIFIMGDDIGWFNVGAYHRGIMSGKTQNLDQLAAQGMLFTDYYAEASCTAGRANFITGELPIRTGMTTVGQAGADVGLPAEASTIAIALKSMGYATGQFGKKRVARSNALRKSSLSTMIPFAQHACCEHARMTLFCDVCLVAKASKTNGNYARCSRST